MSENEIEEIENEVVASELDEASHAEMRLLYGDAAGAISFAKAQQWKTLGGTLLIYFLLILIGRYVHRDPQFVKMVVIFGMVLAGAAIYTLCIYQAWQGTEREKLVKIVRHFSSLAREVIRIKSITEANVHRYILLTFMVALILVGCAVLFMVLSPLYQ